MKNLGDRIYKLRTDKGMSQGDLADRLDVSRQTVSKWENYVSTPELDKIVALSDIFGVSVDYIVKGDETEAVVGTLPSAAGEEEETVRMIRVNPTEKQMTGLSLTLGALGVFSIIFSIVSSYLTAINLPSSSMGGLGFGLVANAFLCIAFFTRKDKIISAALAARAIYILYDFIATFSGEADLFAVSDIIWVAAAVLFPVFYILSNKKNSKLFCVTLIVLVVAELAVRCAAFYINFMSVYDNMSVINGLMSTMSANLFSVIGLTINIGTAVLIYLKGNPAPSYEVPENSYPVRGEMYVVMVKHILLQLFTFGIYNCIWIYKTTENLNSGDDEAKQSGASKLLLCMFVPFYIFYWYYVQSKRLEVLMRKKDMAGSEFALITLILAIFVPIVAASVFLQTKINEYAEK